MGQKVNYNIYITGVGGQGVLTIGDLICLAAKELNTDVSFYPTKGMAQRGGFVEAQIRLGKMLGPSLPPKGADLVLSTELSESLKTIRYLKPHGEAVVLANIWAPTMVMLGRAPYPTISEVVQEFKKANGTIHLIDPEEITIMGRDNIYLLGAAIKNSRLGEIISPSLMEKVISERWPKSANENLATFRAAF